IRGANVPLRAAVLRVGLERFFKRIGGHRFLTQAHENDVNGHPVQPCGKSRFAAERADLAVKLEKSFLHQVFRIGGVTHHPEAQGIDPASMEAVQELKGSGIPGLCQTDSLCFGPRYRLWWSLTGQLSSCGATSSTDAPNRS